MANALTNTHVWAELTINSQVLTPRQLLAAVPYATMAGALSGYDMGAISAADKSAAYFPVTLPITSRTVYLALSNRYYFISATGTLTNWIVESPTTGAAMYKIDLYYDGVSQFAWGGTLQSCKNLPKPPEGYSSYIIEWLPGATNFIYGMPAESLASQTHFAAKEAVFKALAHFTKENDST
ncbi:MAG: hypothetical protein EOM64_04505 [Erysipelotrichia bacterium]|nr:hypothetical protein [Erysipelotrichia bacterium]